jgi:hypothetical protein
MYLWRCAGTIPDTWTRFPALQELAVYKMDRLTGTLPAAFSRLRQLQKLQMQDCGFTGTLPAAWSALTKLEHLYLTNNRLNGEGTLCARSRLSWEGWQHPKHPSACKQSPRRSGHGANMRRESDAHICTAWLHQHLHMALMD